MKLTLRELRFWIRLEGKSVTLKSIKAGREILGCDPITGKEI